MYLSQEMTVNALKSMKKFSSELFACFKQNNMPLDNVCRRNQLMSQAQEQYFSDELRKVFPLTINDGRTGMPDIIIPELEVELECKLTSLSGKGCASFQADHQCFGESGKDFLYVVTDENFANFLVLHFEKLVRSDYDIYRESSKGKVSMKKNKTYDRCTVLYGNYEPRSSKMIKKIEEEIQKTNPKTKKYQNLLKRKAFWENSNESFSIRLSPV